MSLVQNQTLDLCHDFFLESDAFLRQAVEHLVFRNGAVFLHPASAHPFEIFIVRESDLHPEVAVGAASEFQVDHREALLALLIGDWSHLDGRLVLRLCLIVNLLDHKEPCFFENPSKLVWRTWVLDRVTCINHQVVRNGSSDLNSSSSFPLLGLN